LREKYTNKNVNEWNIDDTWGSKKIIITFNVFQWNNIITFHENDFCYLLYDDEKSFLHISSKPIDLLDFITIYYFVRQIFSKKKVSDKQSIE
jgi:hypothetical protein